MSEPKSSFGISTAKHSQLAPSLNAVPKGKSRLAELRSVLVVGTLIAVTILLGSWGLYWREASTIEHQLLIQEANGVNLQVQVFVRELQSAANQLLLLADGDALRSFLESGDPADLEHATQRAVFVSLQQDRFDQLRFLNENGWEVIRVNQGGQVVPPTELQNKSDRPYFKKTWVLNSGQLYLSEFDLNIEHDRIEMPHKPVIRIATPVFDQSGRRRGVYVTNYLGSALLDQLQQARPTLQSRLRLLNAHGHWLKAKRPDLEWGNVLSDRNEMTLASTAPALWSRIGEAATGRHFLEDGGMFTWQRLDLSGVMRDSRQGIVAEEKFLVIGSEVAGSEIRSMMAGLRKAFLLGTFILLAITAASGRVWHKLNQSRQELRQGQEFLATLTQSIGDAVVATDARECVTWMNSVARRLTGWAEAEAFGRPLMEVCRGIDEVTRQPAQISAVSALAAGETALSSQRLILLSRDGRETFVSLGVSPIVGTTDEISGRLFVFRDATSEKNHELRLAQRVAELDRQYQQQTASLREREEHLRLFVENAPAAVAMFDRQMRYLAVSRRFLADYRISMPNVIGKNHYEVFPESPERWKQIHQRCLAGAVEQCEADPFPLPEGMMEWVRWEIHPWHDSTGEIGGIVLFSEVITERRRAETRERNRQRIFERLAADDPLQNVLSDIAQAVEAEEDSSLCSILLVDKSGQRLLHGAAPSLPDFYNQAIHGIAIGENVGCCGTAAFLGKSVIASDILTHPGWTSFRELAGRVGVRSCWSEPILSASGKVLGTFAIYHRESREPNEQDRERIAWAADFARLAIERKHAQAALMESERFQRATLDALTSHIAVLDEQGRIIAVNQAWKEFSKPNQGLCASCDVGVNYLDVCDGAAAAGDTDAAQAARAIRQVLAGQHESWVHEYPCHSPTEDRWFYCRVTRFPTGDSPRVVVAHENITPLRLAQKKLAAVEQMYESLSRVSPVGILLFDAAGKCIDTNQSWRDLCGNTLENSLGDGWHAVIHPDDRQRVVQAWQDSTQRAEPFKAEFRVREPSGKSDWVVSEGLPIRNATGEVTGFIRVSTDITEQKQIEQALRILASDLARLNGNEFYQEVVRQLAKLVDCEWAFICRRDVAHPDQFLTVAFQADGQHLPNFSYAAAGTPCEQVTDQKSCVISSEAWRQYSQDPFLIEHKVEAYVGVPFVDGQGRHIGHIGVMSRRPMANADIVERLAKLFAVSVVAEMDRVASERRYFELFEFSPDAIVITDRDGFIVQANRQVASVFGWAPEELLGKPVEELMPPDLRAGHPALRERYLQTALPRAMGSGRTDLLGLRKDGSAFPVDISLSPMNTSEGLLVAAAVRDVTERQEVLKELQAAAQELRSANAIIEQERAQLANRVAERTSDLTTANEELVRASRFKSEFLATMSHELRTPLNGVLGMNELLMKTPLTDKQREFVEASSTSGRALLSLVNDVLDLSKIEAGKLELDLHGCDLEALAYDVIAMFTHRAKQKELSLSCRLDPETCVGVLCDDTRLRQILVNLLGNALKFTTTGRVILESKCLQRDDRRIVVRFAVTDTGLGVPDDKLDRLFSPFAQVDRSTTRQFGGTGLGLSISKQLVELMGGTIGARSRLGVGSTFWIEIPLELVNADVRTAQCRQILAGTKVLAVDGVDKERRQIADCLDAWGCPFQHVGTLREAVEAVAQAERNQQPFAVILADCRLAIGDEFVHLQNLARRPNVPVIGLGIGEGNDLASHLRQLGLRHLLRDPVRPSALFNALTSVLAVSPPLLRAEPQPDTPADQRSATLAGHILVAEDNHINQLFLIELLKHCGCTCDVANNGDEALSALQQKTYDLVLMDCQMPEMDGFTATREIRRREAAQATPTHIPIVALTANALKGDRERCLEAGMDDYLGKPLQARQLQAMLEKHLRPRTSEIPDEPSA